MLRSRLGVGVAITVFGIAATACSPTDEGQAAPSPSSNSSSSPPMSPSASGGDSPSLADIDPCSLLSSDELSSLGNFPEGKPENVGSARTCGFKKERQKTTDPGLDLGVNIREEQGIGDAQDMGMGIDRTEANGRELAQIPGPGGCTIAIGVSDTSRVDIVVVGDEGTQQACNDADKVAAIVEPKLPG